MKALVTGIAGFTGRYLAETLATRGISVVGIAQSPAKVPHADRVHAVNIADTSALREVMLLERPDFVIHLAAISFVVHDDVEEIYRTNLLGTRNLLEALTALSEAPRLVLLASSSNVYGNRHSGALIESLPPDPVNDYSVSKVAAEFVAGLYRSRLPICIVRPFNYTGVGQDESYLVPKIVEHFRRREEVMELGNLEVARDFSDVRTIVDAYCRILKEPAAVGQTFNICSGRPVTLRQIVEAMGKLTGHSLRIEVNPAFVRPNDVRVLAGSKAKVEQLIGPLLPIPLEETLDWMLKAPTV